MNQYRNLTDSEFVRDVEAYDSHMADEIARRLAELTEQLEAARAEIKDLENGPLCTDDDHCDFEHYKTFFEDARDIIGINGAWSEVYEVADQMREALHEEFS